MQMAFVLRFQEARQSAPEGPVCTGTETHTYVRAEQVDSDPRKHDFRSIPSDTECCLRHPVINRVELAVQSGTKTVTETRQEAADNDPSSRMFDSVPKAFSR